MSLKIKTYHLIVLDKSGSMSSVRDVTISGLNEQLQSVRQSQIDLDDQEQRICFVTFNKDVDSTLRWNVPIEDVNDFAEEDYVPNGGTALNDAICTGINKLKKEIKDELYDRTANVMVTIMTDGHENASTEFTATQAKELVAEVETTGRWTISFIGCGNNVFDVASSYGISHGNTMSYSAGLVGTAEAFKGMAHSRSLRTSAYSEIHTSGMAQVDMDKAISCLNVKDAFFDLDVVSKTEVQKVKGKEEKKKE